MNNCDCGLINVNLVIDLIIERVRKLKREVDKKYAGLY